MSAVMAEKINIDEQMLKLKKAHLRILKHPETCLYGGVVLMGKSEVEDKPYTAYTDGKNKRYSAQFLEGLAIEEVTASCCMRTCTSC